MAVREGRVGRVLGGAARGDIGIDGPEMGGEGVAEPLRVAARERCGRATRRPHECRVLDEDLVGSLAVPQPQPVGFLGIPGDRGRRAVDLVLERVLPTGADLADGHGPASPVLEPKQDRRGVFGGDVADHRIPRDLGRESLHGAGRLVTTPDERRQVRHDCDDPLARHERHEVQPVRPDVADRPQPTAALGLQAPVPVAVEKQPVLEIVSGHEPDVADLAVDDDVMSVLVQRVEADVEVHRVDESRRRSHGDELERLVGRHRQRLLADDVPASGKGGPGLREMQVVGRRHVDRPRRTDRRASRRGIRRHGARPAWPHGPRHARACSRGRRAPRRRSAAGLRHARCR